jgi:branched-chain amino acid transport system substrate-binding protein
MRIILPIVAILLAGTTPLVAEPFKVGVSAPFTGELAEYGEAVRNGFEMSMAEHPGSQLLFRFEDNQYDAKAALSAYRKLVGEEKVNAFFSWGEAPLHAVAPLVERQGMPTVAMSVDTAPAEGNPSIILSINTPSQFVDKLRSELRSRGLKRIGFVVTEDPFTQGLFDVFAKTKLPDETVEVIASVPSSERDFKTIATKVARSGYDAIGVYLLSGQVQSMYRELGKLRFARPSFGSDVFESRGEVEGAGGAIEGALYPNLLVPADFRSRYRARFAKDSQVAYAYNSYVVGRWFLSAFGAGQDVARTDVLGRLKSLPLNESVKVRVAPNEVTYLDFPLVVRRVGRGDFEDL